MKNGAFEMNQKEKILRQEIQRIIKSTLSEGDYSKKKEDTNEQDLGRATSTTSGRIDRLVDTQYMRALQKSLQVGSPSQKAAAVLMIVQKLIGDDTQAVEKLKRELQTKSVRSAIVEPPVDDAVTENVAEQDGLRGALAGKKERMEKTQAFRMLTRALQGKPATQQVDFVFAMLDSLPLDQAAKNRLRMKFRSEFK
jgi:hypothetical protein